MENIYFLTFADDFLFRRHVVHSFKQIQSEALQFGFKAVFAYNRHDLDRVFWNKHKKFIKSHPRGFGYWIWKPQIILQVLEKIPKGSFLIYADSGCHLNIKGKERLKEYEKLARSHEGGLNLLSFALEKDSEYILQYCKMDTYNLLNCERYDKNCMATAIMCINTDSVRDFMREWLSICTKDNYHYVDDSPSLAKNHPLFKDHRHDQVIYSALAQKYNAKIIADETYPADDKNWNLLETCPIHAIRRKRRLIIKRVLSLAGLK